MGKFLGLGSSLVACCIVGFALGQGLPANQFAYYGAGLGAAPPTFPPSLLQPTWEPHPYMYLQSAKPCATVVKDMPNSPLVPACNEDPQKHATQTAPYSSIPQSIPYSGPSYADAYIGAYDTALADANAVPAKKGQLIEREQPEETPSPFMPNSLPGTTFQPLAAGLQPVAGLPPAAGLPPIAGLQPVASLPPATGLPPAAGLPAAAGLPQALPCTQIPCAEIGAPPTAVPCGQQPCTAPVVSQPLPAVRYAPPAPAPCGQQPCTAPVISQPLPAVRDAPPAADPCNQQPCAAPVIWQQPPAMPSSPVTPQPWATLTPGTTPTPTQTVDATKQEDVQKPMDASQIVEEPTPTQTADATKQEDVQKPMDASQIVEKPAPLQAADATEQKVQKAMDALQDVEKSTINGSSAEAGAAASREPHQPQQNSKAEPMENKQGTPESQQSESMKKDSTAAPVQETLSAAPMEGKEELVVPSQEEMLAPLSTSNEASKDKAKGADETTGTSEATDPLDPLDPLEPRQLQQKSSTDSTGKAPQLETPSGNGEKLKMPLSKEEVLFPTRSPPTDLFVADDNQDSGVRMQRRLRSPLSGTNSIDVSNVTFHRSPQDAADNEQEVHARKRDAGKRRLRGANEYAPISAKDLHSRDLFQIAFH